MAHQVARLSGKWVSPTITGDRAANVGGLDFSIPLDAEAKVIDAGRFRIVHVKLNEEPPRVVVLCGLGQLDETLEESRDRGSRSAWANLGYSPF